MPNPIHHACPLGASFFIPVKVGVGCRLKFLLREVGCFGRPLLAHTHPPSPGRRVHLEDWGCQGPWRPTSNPPAQMPGHWRLLWQRTFLLGCRPQGVSAEASCSEPWPEVLAVTVPFHCSVQTWDTRLLSLEREFSLSTNKVVMKSSSPEEEILMISTWLWF